MGEICPSKKQKNDETSQQKCGCMKKVTIVRTGSLRLTIAENLMGNSRMATLRQDKTQIKLGTLRFWTLGMWNNRSHSWILSERCLKGRKKSRLLQVMASDLVLICLFRDQEGCGQKEESYQLFSFNPFFLIITR